jgi:hypothetical protein
MKIEVEREDLRTVLQTVDNRSTTTPEFARLTAACRRPKLHVEARRWFQKTYGNTYHSIRIYVNDEQVHHNPCNYGYGDQWLQTAIEWLHENGYCDKVFGTQYFREELGGTYSVADVDRRKDL